MEIWKDIKGYEGLYQVSNLGRVKSLSRYSFGEGRQKRKLKEKILKPTNKKEYFKVRLYNRSGYKFFKIHHLVAINFLNYSKSKKYIIDHVNNNKSDNRVENLQIITQRQNLSKDKKNKTSKYTGVSWDKENKKWRAVICIKGKNKCLGRYKSEYQANLVYKKTIKDLL